MTHRTTSIVCLAAGCILAWLLWTYDVGPKSVWAEGGYHFAHHKRIVEDRAPSPYQYRILVPWVAQYAIGGVRAVTGGGERRAHDWVYPVVYIVLASGMYLSLARMLRLWYGEGKVALGVLLMALGSPLITDQYYFGPEFLLETTCWSLGIYAILKGRMGEACLVVLVASLNGERSCFLVLAMALMLMRERTFWHADLCAVWGMIWLLVFLGLRGLLGSREHITTLDWTWHHNTEWSSLARMARVLPLALGAPVFCALRGWRGAPRILLRTIPAMVCYIAAITVWGIWYESRIWWAMLPVTTALGLPALNLGEVDDGTSA